MAAKASTYKEPRVTIYIPKSEVNEGGVTVDQTEHVTINGKTTLIQRGVRVDVPVDVLLPCVRNIPICKESL